MIQVAAQPDVEEMAVLERRRSTRRRISAAVVFGCFTTSGTQRVFPGSMHDCTPDGMRIESDVGFRKGTILLIRVMQCPFHLLAPEISESVRTMMLAEVKWHQTFTEGLGTRHAMGVRCL